jgi:hypothetical protein
MIQPRDGELRATQGASFKPAWFAPNQSIHLAVGLNIAPKMAQAQRKVQAISHVQFTVEEAMFLEKAFGREERARVGFFLAGSTSKPPPRPGPIVSARVCGWRAGGHHDLIDRPFPSPGGAHFKTAQHNWQESVQVDGARLGVWRHTVAHKCIWAQQCP